MQKSLLLAGIALLAGLLAWMIFGLQPADDHRHTRLLSSGSELPPGGDFVLHGNRGEVRLQDFRGQVVVLYFGYTWCPDICPTNLSLISSVMNELTAGEREGVQPIFVSVDPRRDTVARLQEYTEYFHPKIIGITGSDREVAEAAARYGVAYRAVNPDTDSNYAVDHSADTYLIDRQGRLARRLPHATPAKIMLQAIRDLLRPADSR